MADPDLRDMPRLLTDVLRHALALARSEARLLRAELSQSLSRAISGLGFAAGALALAVVALNMFATAGAAWLERRGVDTVEAAAAVGGALLVLALVCALVARTRLNRRALTPRRSIDNVKRDFEAPREVRRGG